jgi:hypothetical protein
MTDDRFFERLRDDAQSLRYAGDPFMTARIAARVRARIEAQPTVSLFLARWLRPIAASLSAVALAGCISVAVMESTSGDTSLDSLTASSMEISMAGDVYRVGE